MAETKTKPTAITVEAFLDTVEPEVRREEARSVVARLEALTGERPVMWGPSIIGFGVHHYVYESGRAGDTARIGFSPRKAALTFYGLIEGEGGTDLAPLGKHTTGKGCLYVKKLSDIDLTVFDAVVRAAWTHRT